MVYSQVAMFSGLPFIMNTPIKQKVAVGYIRESTEEQDKGYSPENQQQYIKDYAERNNLKLLPDFYKDLRSGRSADKRDNFQRMIQDAMQKKFDVILFFHTSRFARNVEESRRYKKLLRNKLGIEVISVTQHFGQVNDPSAFLNEGINELFDEYRSHDTSFWVKSNLLHKRMKGKQNGNPPFGYFKKKIGYDKEKEKTIYEPDWRIDQIEAKWVKKIFTWYATGKYSFTDIAFKLNAAGVKTKKHRIFTHSSIKDLIHNRIYLGVIPPSKNNKELLEIPGQHPPIINESLYKKCVEVASYRRSRIGRPIAKRRFYMLQGLVNCYRCIHRLKDVDKNEVLFPRMYCQTHQWKDAQGKHNEKLTYTCKFRKETKSCKQSLVEARQLDRDIEGLMCELIFPEHITEQILEEVANILKETKEESANSYSIKQLEQQKKRLTFVFTNTDELSEQQYASQLAAINAQISQYENLTGYRKTKTDREHYIKLTRNYLNNFHKFWSKELADTEKRDWIQTMIKRIWIKDADIEAIEPHADFKPFFTALMKLLGQAPSVTP